MDLIGPARAGPGPDRTGEPDSARCEGRRRAPGGLVSDPNIRACEVTGGKCPWHPWQQADACVRISGEQEGDDDPGQRAHRVRHVRRRPPRRRARGRGAIERARDGHRHPPVGPGHAVPEPAALRRRGGRRQRLRAHRGAAVLHDLLRRRPRSRARHRREHPRHPHDLRRRRVVVRRPPHLSRRPAAHEAALRRLQGVGDQVRRPHHVQPGRDHLHQPAGRAGGQAVVDGRALPRRRGARPRLLRAGRPPADVDRGAPGRHREPTPGVDPQPRRGPEPDARVRRGGPEPPHPPHRAPLAARAWPRSGAATPSPCGDRPTTRVPTT